MSAVNEILLNPWTGPIFAILTFAVIFYLYATRTKK